MKFAETKKNLSLWLLILYYYYYYYFKPSLLNARR